MGCVVVRALRPNLSLGHSLLFLFFLCISSSSSSSSLSLSLLPLFSPFPPLFHLSHRWLMGSLQWNKFCFHSVSVLVSHMTNYTYSSLHFCPPPSFYVWFQCTLALASLLGHVLIMSSFCHKVSNFCTNLPD